MAAEKVYIPQSLLDLRQELDYHPQLVTTLRLSQMTGFEDQLAEIAAYCGVVVDGYFTPAEISQLADLLTERLREKRVIVLN